MSITLLVEHPVAAVLAADLVLGVDLALMPTLAADVERSYLGRGSLNLLLRSYSQSYFQATYELQCSAMNSKGTPND